MLKLVHTSLLPEAQRDHRPLAFDYYGDDKKEQQGQATVALYAHFVALKQCIFRNYFVNPALFLMFVSHYCSCVDLTAEVQDEATLCVPVTTELFDVDDCVIYITPNVNPEYTPLHVAFHIHYVATVACEWSLNEIPHTVLLDIICKMMRNVIRGVSFYGYEALRKNS